jgi:hypothetical protein
MFVLESKGSAAAHKYSTILMMVAMAVTGSFGPLLTLHVYVRPSPPPPPGFRIFGFPQPRGQRGNAQSSTRSVVRKALLLVTALAMIAGGLWLLGAELFIALKISFLFIFGGAVLTTLGVYLLWVDFVAPLIGMKEEG